MTNGSTTTYTSNSLNQYTRVVDANDVNYTYDKNGNLTFDGKYRYYYDVENRLTEVNNVTNQRVAAYKYDFKGKRVAKTVGIATTTFVYDGDQIIEEYSNGGPRVRYFYGPRIDEVICRVDISQGGGDPGLYYYYDGLGSVVALGSYMGNAMEKYSYDVFGKMTLKKFSPRGLFGNRYLFTGRELDSETGLYYYRARYYHPSIGRFMQTDPLGGTPDEWNGYLFGISGVKLRGLNIYTYVTNNPVNNVDPTGEIAPVVVLRIFTTGRAITHGILACYYARECSRCLDRARELSTAAAAMLGDRFSDWVTAAKPGAECGELCGPALSHTIEMLVWAGGRYVIYRYEAFRRMAD
jgi:RHS repeat-associated protein